MNSDTRFEAFDGGLCECGARAMARGLCSRCYAQWRRTGGTMRRKCSVAGCENYGSQGGLCGKHYQRQLQHGTTDLLPQRERARRIDVSVAQYVFDAIHEVLDENESLSAFGAEAIANEVARRRRLMGLE